MAPNFASPLHQGERGFAFIEFETPDAVAMCMASPPATLGGQPLKIEPPQSNNGRCSEGRSGRGRSGGDRSGPSSAVASSGGAASGGGGGGGSSVAAEPSVAARAKIDLACFGGGPSVDVAKTPCSTIMSERGVDVGWLRAWTEKV